MTLQEARDDLYHALTDLLESSEAVFEYDHEALTDFIREHVTFNGAEITLESPRPR